jgi:hypothetical protein
MGVWGLRPQEEALPLHPLQNFHFVVLVICQLF